MRKKSAVLWKYNHKGKFTLTVSFSRLFFHKTNNNCKFTMSEYITPNAWFPIDLPREFPLFTDLNKEYKLEWSVLFS